MEGKYRCQLSDGDEVFEEKTMTMIEYYEANNEAQKATDGNIRWFIAGLSPESRERELQYSDFQAEHGHESPDW